MVAPDVAPESVAPESTTPAAAPAAAPATGKASKKKAAPKKAAKKKAAKKAPKAKKPKADRKPREKAELTGNEVLILGTLAKNSKPLNRVQLAEKTEIKKGWSKTLGSSTKEPSADSLEGRGFVKSSKVEGERAITYTITASGTKALERAKAKE